MDFIEASEIEPAPIIDEEKYECKVPSVLGDIISKVQESTTCIGPQSLLRTPSFVKSLISPQDDMNLGIHMQKQEIE